MAKMKQLIYGTAYYDEYMPYERLDKDVEMMKKAGITTVRIAESTWSTCEPQPGVFDFSHVTRVMDAMEAAGISVIIGTPTYAIPTWMVKAHPDVLATTVKGRGIYGARQIMDITHPVYLFYAERVIRKLMECCAKRNCVVGFQVDNETKFYGTAGKNVQERFVKYLREKFHDNLDELNNEFGLDYWSNRINAWEDFPDVRGTINGSLGAEFEKFQRSLVTEFLSWQANIIREYKREDQFITHNFDFEWTGYSYGVQPDVNHRQSAQCLTVAGCDIYHPTQDELTGIEIAFGGDMTRSLKQDNYLVIETEAQGFPCWTPYEGQLRLQAYSHIASGANSVMYWHWHSIHNSFETYWRGILSHDLQENEVYREASIIGNEWKRIGDQLVNLKKKNDVAIVVSNESLTALKWFGIEATASDQGNTSYNNILRWIYDGLFKMNVECDMLWPESENFSDYKVVIVPALYAAPDTLLEKLKEYTKNGGHLVMTFKSAFANENIKVSTNPQPNILSECMGITYQQFTFPKNVKLASDVICAEQDDAQAKTFMELLMVDHADILAVYDHPQWKRYAAITENHYKNGMATYIGCMTSEKYLQKVLERVFSQAEVEVPAGVEYPLVLRKGTNDFGKEVCFYLNYSGEEKEVAGLDNEKIEIISGDKVAQQNTIKIPAWGVKIIE